MSDNLQFFRLPEIKTMRELLDRMLTPFRDELVRTEQGFWFSEFMGGGISYVDPLQVNLAIALGLLEEVPAKDREGPGIAYRCTLTAFTRRG